MKKVLLLLAVVFSLSFISCEKETELEAIPLQAVGNNACTFTIGSSTFTIWWQEGAEYGQLGIYDSNTGQTSQQQILVTDAEATCNVMAPAGD